MSNTEERKLDKSKALIKQVEDYMEETGSSKVSCGLMVSSERIVDLEIMIEDLQEQIKQLQNK